MVRTWENLIYASTAFGFPVLCWRLLVFFTILTYSK
jgi:hypothetical protein